MRELGAPTLNNVSARRPSYRPFGLFRFVLALMVLLQHCLLLLPPAQRTLFYQLELGAVAVTGFFAVSGFIVADALSSFYAGRPFAFLLNRFLRVVPPYLVALGLAILAQSLFYASGRLAPLDAPLLGPPWQKWVLVAAVCEILPGLPSWRISAQDFSFIPFAWTLRIEFAFYLAAFFTAWGMCRVAASARPAILWSAGLIACGIFARFVLTGGGGPLQSLTIPFFAFGICAFAYNDRPSRRTLVSLVATGLLVPASFTFWRQHGHPVLAYQIPWLLAVFGALLALARAKTMSAGLRRLDMFFGKLSYPLYIGHGVVLVSLTSLVTLRDWRLYAAGVVASLALAMALHECCEKPLQRLRDRVRGSPAMVAQ